MKTYKVHVQRVTTDIFYVDAENEVEARSLGLDLAFVDGGGFSQDSVHEEEVDPTKLESNHSYWTGEQWDYIW